MKMIDNLVISTLPIKPQKVTNVGMLIGPTISNVLKDAYQCRNFIGINTLNTYEKKDDQVDILKKDLDNNYINYDKIVIDKDNDVVLLNKISELVQKGLIKPKLKKKLICDCGRVDILEDSINNNAKLYHYDKDKIVCNSCNSVCKVFYEKVLCLELLNTIDDDVEICPTFLKKEMKGFSKTFKGSDLLISKKRDTGYKINVNNEGYNIDIDFIWSNFFNLFDEDNEVLIASNHQLLIMYLMNYLAKLTSDKRICFLATPYIRTKKANDFDNYFLKDVDVYKKLFILYNLKWKQKDCLLSESIIKFLDNTSETKLNNLYKTILTNADEYFINSYGLAEQINLFLERGTNQQENIKTMKRLYKERRL